MLLSLLAGSGVCHGMLVELRRRIPKSADPVRESMVTSLMYDAEDLLQSLSTGRGQNPLLVVGHMRSMAARLRGFRWTPVVDPRFQTISETAVRDRSVGWFAYLVMKSLTVADVRHLEESLASLSELLVEKQEK